MVDLPFLWFHDLVSLDDEVGYWYWQLRNSSCLRNFVVTFLNRICIVLGFLLNFVVE